MGIKRFELRTPVRVGTIKVLIRERPEDVFDEAPGSVDGPAGVWSVNYTVQLLDENGAPIDAYGTSGSLLEDLEPNELAHLRNFMRDIRKRIEAAILGDEK